MRGDVNLGWLQEVNVRDVWRHEAQDFTPWLAEHLDRLGEVLGLRLELEGTEVAVEGFAADIMARDVSNGSLVLIENQLERTDHGHLGQILTYLAGLDARRIIWIAADFQEPHLSAIRWLNEHTADDFAFFAVRLRVVRIGDSPCAPVFEVLARPSEWERQLIRQRRAEEYTPEAEKRREFWKFYLQRHPEAGEAGLEANRHWAQWLPIHVDDETGAAIQLSLSIGAKSCGLFVRGGWGKQKFSAIELLREHSDILKKRLNLPDNHYAKDAEGHVFGEFRPFSYLDESSWPQLVDWMEERRVTYMREIRDVLKTGQDDAGRLNDSTA